MFSLKLIKFSLLLFSVNLYAKTCPSAIINADRLDKLLIYSGWTNLNELTFIIYLNKIYDRQHLIGTSTNHQQCNIKIQALTIYLGCIYAKVMYNFLVVISNILQKCQKKMKENDLINGCICTETLINIISILIVPMAKLMKGAIKALGLLLSTSSKRDPFYHKDYSKITNFLKEIENICDRLNKIALSRNSISTYAWALQIIHLFFKKIDLEVRFIIDDYCVFVPYDTNYLWSEWVQEYNGIISQGIILEFFKFLKGKIRDYIKTVIIEKYFQLGFKFDPITEESFIPSKEELIELELEFKETDGEPSMQIQIETH
ncbi:uncharacterized protein LOC126907209 [Daktulosphaira vitifoliae]|uniref:uncharacterized protein LOC126907209 n=1 Tax=Daktulosphaira vitifoliae TaxID=58002 RepID=UPI0021AA0025|nr:uncharacterized protein LOC126907209 [Daktulosphaira vitifoliae]